MISITIDANDTAELLRHLHDLASSLAGIPAQQQTQTVTTVTVEPIKKSAKPEKEPTPEQLTIFSEEPIDNVVAMNGPSPGKKRGRPPKKQEQESELDLTDIRAALTNYMSTHTEDETAALLKTYGDNATQLSKLKPELYQAVYDAAMEDSSA